MKKIFFISLFFLFSNVIFSQSKLKRDIMEAKQTLIINGYSVTGISNDSIISIADSLKLVTQHALKEYVDRNSESFVPDGVTITVDGTVDTNIIQTKMFFSSLEELDTLTSVPVESILINQKTGAKYKVQRDSVFIEQGVAFRSVGSSYAVLQQRENGYLFTDFNGDVAGRINNDSIIDYMIRFQKALGDDFNVEFNEGTVLISKKINLTKYTFDKVNIKGNNTLFLYDVDTLTTYRVFDITANDVIIDDVRLNGQFEEIKNTYDTVTTNLSDFNVTNANTTYDGSKIIFNNTGYAAISLGYSATAGDRFLVKLNVDTASSSSNSFRWFGANTQNFGQGYNEFIYEINNNATLLQVIAFNPSYMEISQIEVLKITGSYFQKEWNLNTASFEGNDAIKIRTRSTQEEEVNNCVIRNVRVDNTPFRAINIQGNSFTGFKEVFVDNAHGDFTTEFCITNGLHHNVRVTNSSNKRMKYLGFDGGLKAYAINNTSFSTKNRTVAVFENISVKYGGLGGGAIFLSGAFQSAHLSNLSLDRFGYYRDTTGNDVAYENNSGTDPNRINSPGGSIITKIDPVLYYKDQQVLINNVIITNSNDTSSLFMPIVFAANGTHNLRMSNINADNANFSLQASEGPTSTAGSETGFMYLSNSQFDCSSSIFTLPKNVIVDNCIFYQDYAINNSPPSGNSTYWARFNEYPDSLHLLNSKEFIRIGGGVLSNSTIINGSIRAGDGNNNNATIENVKIKGVGKLQITRGANPLVLQDTTIINIDNYFGGIDFYFRSLEGKPSDYIDPDDNLFLNISNSSVKMINNGGGANYPKSFSILPHGVYDNVKHIDYKIERTDADNFTYTPYYIDNIQNVSSTATSFKNKVRITSWTTDFNLNFDSLLTQRNQLVEVYDTTGSSSNEITISFQGRQIANTTNNEFVFNKPFQKVVFEIQDGIVYIKENTHPDSSVFFEDVASERSYSDNASAVAALGISKVYYNTTDKKYTLTE